MTTKFIEQRLAQFKAARENTDKLIAAFQTQRAEIDKRLGILQAERLANDVAVQTCEALLKDAQAEAQPASSEVPSSGEEKANP